MIVIDHSVYITPSFPKNYSAAALQSCKSFPNW